MCCWFVWNGIIIVKTKCILCCVHIYSFMIVWFWGRLFSSPYYHFSVQFFFFVLFLLFCSYNIFNGCLQILWCFCFRKGFSFQRRFHMFKWMFCAMCQTYWIHWNRKHTSNAFFHSFHFIYLNAWALQILNGIISHGG